MIAWILPDLSGNSVGPENTNNTCIATALDERKYQKICLICSIAQTPRGYPFVSLKVKSSRIKNELLVFVCLEHKINYNII